MKYLHTICFGLFGCVIAMVVWLAITAEPYSNEFGQPPEEWNRDTVFTQPFVDSTGQLKWREEK